MKILCEAESIVFGKGGKEILPSFLDLLFSPAIIIRFVSVWKAGCEFI